MEDLVKTIGKTILKVLIDKGLINKISIRNAELRNKYSQLRKKGYSAKKARELLLKEPYVYYNGEAQHLSERNLKKILYQNGKKER